MTPADEGITGTSTKKRKQFNKMIADAEAGKFDLILTKEVSRFARNTVDTLQHTRNLKGVGIGVIFLNDNINSLDPDSELRLTIMASIAQEESRKTSERVKWGQRRSMEKGVVFGNKILGYTLTDGKLTVNPTEAETVKLIFHKYLYEGKGLTAIARELEQAGILTGGGSKRWDATNILRMLTNEKYCGDLKQQKGYTPNYLEHRRATNNGALEFVILRDNHDPIIERNIFDRTQAEIARRGNMKESGSAYTNRYAFSGKLYCGLCGTKFVSRNRKANDSVRDIRRWQCGRYFKYGFKQNDDRGCENKMIRNEVLEHIFRFALRDAIDNKDVIIDECIKLVSRILDENRIESEYSDTVKELERLENRKNRLMGLYLDETITKAEFIKQKEPIDAQISEAEKKLAELNSKMALRHDSDNIIESVKERVTNIVYAEEFSDEVAAEVLEKIVIHGKDRYDVYFKGADTDFF